MPPLPTTIRPFIKKGDIGQQLEGGGGVVDAPAAGASGEEDQRRQEREIVMTSRHVASSRNNERGAVLIQVAVALLALLALSSFVFDYGVMWVSRGQAQNAADAGALSGAISLAFDSGTDKPGARAKAIAHRSAESGVDGTARHHQRRRHVPAVSARGTGTAGYLREGRRVSQPAPWR